MSLREQFFNFDDELGTFGVKPCSAWWRKGIGDWLDAYENNQVLELWGCVGRGAAKSTALYKLALFFMLFGDFEVPPGEVHYAIVLSRVKEEASKGVDIIDRWLTLLGIRHRLAGSVIELQDYPRGIRVVAASVAATSGFRAFFVGKDERSKWAAEGSVELDAEEVDTSAAAMTATHALAPIVAFGSAWGITGAFYDAITKGSDENRVSLGPTPTWVAAPHITEASTKKKEKNPKRWAREYKCEFVAGATSAFDSDEIEEAFKARDLVAVSAPVLVLDPSSGRGDVWAFGLARWAQELIDSSEQWLYEAKYDEVLGKAVKGKLLRDSKGALVPNPDYQDSSEPILAFNEVGGFKGTFSDNISGETIVAKLAAFAKKRGVSTVISDQREAFLLESAFNRHGLRFIRYDWTVSSKPEAYLHMTRLFRERRAHFENATDDGGHAAQMKSDLLTIEEVLMPSGAVTYRSKRTSGGHGDYSSLCFTAAMHDLSGEFRGSPVRHKRGVVVQSRQCGPA